MFGRTPVVPWLQCIPTRSSGRLSKQSLIPFELLMSFEECIADFINQLTNYSHCNQIIQSWIGESDRRRDLHQRNCRVMPRFGKPRVARPGQKNFRFADDSQLKEYTSGIRVNVVLASL